MTKDTSVTGGTHTRQGYTPSHLIWVARAFSLGMKGSFSAICADWHNACSTAPPLGSARALPLAPAASNAFGPHATHSFRSSTHGLGGLEPAPRPLHNAVLCSPLACATSQRHASTARPRALPFMSCEYVSGFMPRRSSSVTTWSYRDKGETQRNSFRVSCHAR